MNHLVFQLSEKIKTEATVWRIIAVLQVVIGVATLIINLVEGAFEGALYGGVVLLIAARNFKISKEDMQYAQNVVMQPVGIVAKFEPLSPLIIDLVYNTLVGGLIGVVACVFSFLTRNFVVSNKQAFNALEAGFNAANSVNYANNFNQINYQNQ